MVSPRNERVFIRDLNELTLEILIDPWLDSMNVSMKHSIAWDNSRHAPSWRFYMQWGIEETGCPGIICIICYQVLLHLSEHATSSLG